MTGFHEIMLCRSHKYSIGVAVSPVIRVTLICGKLQPIRNRDLRKIFFSYRCKWVQVFSCIFICHSLDFKIRYDCNLDILRPGVSPSPIEIQFDLENKYGK